MAKGLSRRVVEGVAYYLASFVVVAAAALFAFDYAAPGQVLIGATAMAVIVAWGGVWMLSTRK